jgi:rhodanese-related sulfurtransferase
MTIFPKNLLPQAAWVVVVGLVLSVAANALSPRGLRLARNYFPDPGLAGAIPPASPGSSAEGGAAQRLAQRGLQSIAGEDVLKLFEDPRYEQGLVVFVDARGDQHYQAGHIPGAWQFDHYRMEHYLADVLPACLNADIVVVYCGGGDCEDSEFAAILLRDAGVPAENIHVYTGGMTEWRTKQQPVETGERGSGHSGE